MAKKGFDIEIPQYCTFVVAEMNRRIKKLRVANAGKTEQEVLSVLGKFLEKGIEALACGMVTPCDEYWQKVYEYSSERLQTANDRKKRDRERKARAKEGIPNAEPAPIVDEAEGEERKPYGTKKNVWLSDFELQSLRDTFPTIDKREFRIAVDTVSQRYSGRFDVPARDGWLSVMNRELDRMRIDKESRENAQAKLSAAKMYKDIQDAKPKMFQ